MFKHVAHVAQLRLDPDVLPFLDSWQRAPPDGRQVTLAIQDYTGAVVFVLVERGPPHPVKAQEACLGGLNSYPLHRRPYTPARCPRSPSDPIGTQANPSTRYPCYRTWQPFSEPKVQMPA